ncbi:hypothetical protein GW17_00050269 [Ensete ventricosum]|nr:hypothetical protein GW17_00050269 [Ensete ventricosum]
MEAQAAKSGDEIGSRRGFSGCSAVDSTVSGTTGRFVNAADAKPSDGFYGGRRRPQGAADASGLQAIACRGARAVACRQQGQRPPVASPQRGDAHGDTVSGSGRPLAGRLPGGKATATREQGLRRRWCRGGKGFRAFLVRK